MSLFCILGLLTFASCNDVGKRDLKKAMDAVLHEGQLKGYSSVYILDTHNKTYEYDDNPNEPLLQYPIYKHEDGTYTIEYCDGEHTLHQVEDPIDLFGTGNTLLKWRFKESDSRYQYMIEQIPHSDGEERISGYLENEGEMNTDDDKEDTALSEGTAFTPDFFIGKTYVGEGNGGGNVTSLAITFMDDGECEGTSDWYHAFDEPTTFLGTYKMKGDRLLVLFHVNETSFNEDGYDVDFDFEITNEGKVLWHDQTEPGMQGSMWIDTMGLEEQTE